MAKRDVWKQAKGIRCLVCQAEPKQDCRVVRTGKRLPKPHLTRIRMQISVSQAVRRAIMNQHLTFGGNSGREW